MIRKLIPVMALLAVTSGLVGQSLQQVETARDKLQKWVETRQTISKERADWKVQEEFLISSRELLKQNLEEVNASIANLDDVASAADSKRAELTEKKKDFDKATESVRTAVADLEVKIKRMAALFPANLSSQVDPLVLRMPKDPFNPPPRMTLGQRLPNVVAVVNTAGKYNTTLHHHTENVKLDSGQELQVEVLYWGFGLAYFVDGNNSYAGYKFPTRTGWKTVENRSMAPKIRALIDTYQRRNPNIEFIEVPTVIN